MQSTDTARTIKVIAVNSFGWLFQDTDGERYYRDPPKDRLTDTERAAVERHQREQGANT